jgi:transcriptional regulator with XRE-family HTH domain
MRAARRAVGTRQDEFDMVSSRTYVSALERGIKSPTLPKVDDLATVLQIHPLSLLTLSYLQGLGDSTSSLDKLLAGVRSEVLRILQANDPALP